MQRRLYLILSTSLVWIYALFSPVIAVAGTDLKHSKNSTTASVTSLDVVRNAQGNINSFQISLIETHFEGVDGWNHLLVPLGWEKSGNSFVFARIDIFNNPAKVENCLKVGPENKVNIFKCPAEINKQLNKVSGKFVLKSDQYILGEVSELEPMKYNSGQAASFILKRLGDQYTVGSDNPQFDIGFLLRNPFSKLNLFFLTGKTGVGGFPDAEAGKATPEWYLLMVSDRFLDDVFLQKKKHSEDPKFIENKKEREIINFAATPNEDSKANEYPPLRVRAVSKKGCASVLIYERGTKGNADIDSPSAFIVDLVTDEILVNNVWYDASDSALAPIKFAYEKCQFSDAFPKVDIVEKQDVLKAPDNINAVDFSTKKHQFNFRRWGAGKDRKWYIKWNGKEKPIDDCGKGRRFLPACESEVPFAVFESPYEERIGVAFRYNDLELSTVRVVGVSLKTGFR
jgi:hypothetical protein